MNPGNPAEQLFTTAAALRERMVRQLEARGQDDPGRRDLERALAELDLIWEELQGQATLLTRESERYAEYFEYAPDACLITDAGGSVREANQAALELLHAKREDVVGRVLEASTAATSWQVGVGGLCWLIKKNGHREVAV